uniref:Alpha-1,3-mannosyl-glycoprotein 2-beta-N-acetylglucosaminyltransferase n=1 Tax=Ditylenchus dipsaci TaxID=166011 RepID=A0A915EBK9_9BILA
MCDLICRFKHSHQASQELALLTDKALISLSATRWGSVIQVIKRFLELQKSVVVIARRKNWPSRATATRRYRTSTAHFPIVISHDCDNSEVKQAAKEFASQVHYVKHISSETARLKVPVSHQRYAMYYKISRHYRLGLTHVFEKMNHTSVIITEDDLDISPDFFHYFNAARWLLHRDKSLYCVSAWNDNGKPNLIDSNAKSLLYRSDFFSGLGWMMTNELWKEIGNRWPPGFWMIGFESQNSAKIAPVFVLKYLGLP